MNIYIRANNTFFLITSDQGKVLYSQSLGKIRRKKSRGLTLETINAFLQCHLLRSLHNFNVSFLLTLKGFSKNSIIYQLLGFLLKLKFKLISIKYKITSAHNGCKIIGSHN